MQCRLGLWVDWALIAFTTMAGHGFKPNGAGFFAGVFHEPKEMLSHRLDADEMQDVPFKAAYGMGQEEPAVYPAGRAHGDEQPRRPAPQQALRKIIVVIGEGIAGAQCLFPKRLQKGGHGAEPQRKDDDQMIGPPNRVLGGMKRRRWCRMLEICLRAQYWKIQLSDIDDSDGMAGVFSRFGVLVGDGMTKMAAVIVGVALNDQNMTLITV